MVLPGFNVLKFTVKDEVVISVCVKPVENTGGLPPVEISVRSRGNNW